MRNVNTQAVASTSQKPRLCLNRPNQVAGESVLTLLGKICHLIGHREGSVCFAGMTMRIFNIFVEPVWAHGGIATVIAF